MILIDGHLGGTVLSAFLAPAPEQRGARTVLTVLLDQSALYGVLKEIRALVLDLDPVRLDQFRDFADKYGISSDELITRMDDGP
jgi:hypothetical protein